VVDDDEGLLRLIEKALRREGWETAAATSGREALAMLPAVQPDLILIDLKLPDMSGAALIEILQQAKSSPPFVVITGQGDERVAVEMMKKGAQDYLVKDGEFIDLLPLTLRRTLEQIGRDRRLEAAENALAMENAFSSAVLDTAAVLIVVLDREGKIVRSNRAFASITGWTEPELKGTMFFDRFVIPEERPGFEAAFRQLTEGGSWSERENQIVSRNGGSQWVAWSNTPLPDRNGTVEHVIATGLDVTERKRLEREIIEISNLEQRRIGQDLHDGICQQLTAIELMTQAVETKLAKRSRRQAAEVAKISRYVRDTIVSTKNLARGLSPVDLDAGGLMWALQDLARVISEMCAIDCTFACEQPILIRNNSAAIHLYRIAQEATHNAVRHGKASRVAICLRADGTQSELSIRDNGTGMAEPKERGMGLSIMRYRSGMIAGSLNITSEPGSGVTVACKFLSTL